MAASPFFYTEDINLNYNLQGSRYSLKTLKSPGIEKAFLRALEKPLKVAKMLKILEKSLNLDVLFVDLSFLIKKHQ